MSTIDGPDPAAARDPHGLKDGPDANLDDGTTGSQRSGAEHSLPGAGVDRPGDGSGQGAAERGAAGGGAGNDGQRGDVLSLATALLRQHTDTGWKAIEHNVLERAMTLFRPSAPVRGRHQFGDFFVAADVVVAHLRQVIDAVPATAADKITCSTGEQDELETVTIQLIAAYGQPLLQLAAEVHAVALRTLQELLGLLAPTSDQVHTHVHIGDVSADPRHTS